MCKVLHLGKGNHAPQNGNLDSRKPVLKQRNKKKYLMSRREDTALDWETARGRDGGNCVIFLAKVLARKFFD